MPKAKRPKNVTVVPVQEPTDRYTGLKNGTIKPQTLTEECVAAGTDCAPKDTAPAKVRMPHTLVSGKVQYTFRVNADGTTAVEFCGDKFQRYTLPREEAVDLWRRLVARGFERFCCNTTHEKASSGCYH